MNNPCLYKITALLSFILMCGCGQEPEPSREASPEKASKPEQPLTQEQPESNTADQSDEAKAFRAKAEAFIQGDGGQEEFQQLAQDLNWE